jgi:hypothetical protein
MATTTNIVLPGGGWVMSWVEDGVVAHSPVIGWVFLGVQIGALPIVVRTGSLTAMPTKDPFGQSDLLWHPDMQTREQAEQQLLARAGGTDR